MPAAVAVPLILGATSTVASIISGHKAGKAAEKAADIQVKAVKEARDYAEPKYAEAQRIAAEQHAYAQQVAAAQLAQSRADLAPYSGAGAGGIAALSNFLGVPSAAPARPAAGSPAMPTLPTAPSAAPASTTMTPLSAVGQRGAQSLEQPGRPPAAQQATQSSYVLLKAPTGETQPVPADQVAFYLARGATKV